MCCLRQAIKPGPSRNTGDSKCRVKSLRVAEKGRNLAIKSSHTEQCGVYGHLLATSNLLTTMVGNTAKQGVPHIIISSTKKNLYNAPHNLTLRYHRKTTCISVLFPLQSETCLRSVWHQQPDSKTQQTIWSCLASSLMSRSAVLCTRNHVADIVCMACPSKN